MLCVFSPQKYLGFFRKDKHNNHNYNANSLFPSKMNIQMIVISDPQLASEHNLILLKLFR